MEGRMANKSHPPSQLFYYGTEIEVQLGDKVRIRRWLRSPREGTVYYVPGISPKHRELEYGDVKQWAIKTTDGYLFPILYDPERFQPPKHIIFVERSNESGVNPREPLDESEQETDEERA
jgi:hypothetical protein